MITIKAKIKNEIHIEDYIRQFNNVKRFAFNRFLEEKSLSEVYHLSCKTLNNCDLLDASFRESAVFKAKELYDTGNHKVIFGGRNNFNKLKYKKESALPLKKNVWLYSQGRSNFKGNRKFNFDLTNNKITFKPERGIKIDIEFENVSKNERKLLDEAQFLAQQKQCPISVSLSQEYVLFSIDETIIKQNRTKIIKNRILSLDSNPENIGISIIDWKTPTTKTIIHKEVIDLSELRNTKTTKKHYELLSVAQRISKLAKHYNCELVAFEKLNIKPKDNKKGKLYNRMVNNNWNRNLFFNNLIKWCNIYDIKTQEIEPAYSSFIGQMMNSEEPDMIAASIELSRRAYLFYNTFITKQFLPFKDGKKMDIVYPEFDLNVLPTRWKKMVESNTKIDSWKKLYTKLKKSELSYRFPFKSWKQDKKSLSHISRKSKILLYL